MILIESLIILRVWGDEIPPRGQDARSKVSSWIMNHGSDVESLTTPYFDV